MPDFSAQMKEEPPINKAIGDLVAIAGGDPEKEGVILTAIMMTCSEKLARSWSRSRCIIKLESIAKFIRDAQPANPWKE